MSDYQALRPRTSWRSHRCIVLEQNPDTIAFGTYVEPCKDPLRAIVSIDLYDRFDAGAGHWLHLSVSRERRLPTWGDLVRARDALGYQDRCFVQLVPPRSHWLNVHSHTLHLLHRLDAPTVPDTLWRDVAGAGVGPYEHTP